MGMIATPTVSTIALLDVSPTTVTIYGLAALLTVSAIVALLLLRKLRAAGRKLDQAAQQLAEQETYTQAVLDALPFPVIARDRCDVFLMINSRSRSECGIESSALGHTSLALPARGSFIGEGGETAHRRFYDTSLASVASGEAQQREINYTDLDGGRRVAIWHDCPIHAGDRGVIGSLGVLLNITRYREVQDNLRINEQSLREITQRIPLVVFTVHRGKDQLRRLAYLTGDLHALFNVDPEQLVATRNILRDWPILERIHPDDQPNVIRMTRDATRHLNSTSLDFRAFGADGLHWIHLAMAPRRLLDGAIHWTGYLLDTTAINRHNETLLAARDAAERASKAKADFLATMSHEIRTPMNGVLGMLELLGHTKLDAEQQELLSAVEDSAGVLLQILKDVLDFSKLEAGNLHLNEAPFDPRTLVDNIVSSLSSHMHRSGLHVQVTVDAALAGTLKGDSVRIRQILLNLINNASKFTEHGSIVVGLRVLSDDDLSQRIRLTVRDTGIGIAEEKQGLLFTPFAQAESWTARRYGGTGLGLAICRHLLQLMGGSITLESRLGVGTTVTVELKLPIDKRQVERPPGLTGRHAVLRLESNETAVALSDHLTALGITVERIHRSETLRAGLAANLLFVDVGDEQGAGAIAAQTVVVDRHSVSRAGPFAKNDLIHLSANPLKWQSVMRACVMALEPINAHDRTPAESEPSSTPDEATKSSRGSRGRVLIAEDHPVGQALARRQFELLGWACDIVDDGEAAYDALIHGDYALLITDCQMPVMDGYELATTWRQHEAIQGMTTRMPIIAMTAGTLDDEVIRCRLAGMDDYMSKPVQLRELDLMLETWLSNRSVETKPRHMAARKANEERDLPLEPTIVDEDMIRVMVETSWYDLRQLDQAVTAGDTVEAARRLHRMLGALQLFTDGPIVTEGRKWLEDLSKPDAGLTLQKLSPYLKRLDILIEDLDRPKLNQARLRGI
ncbi:ATP-binding protein [Rhodanobacter sp. L36]|uniref:ATP-binding protein n=1 Tax=Rhodanobacter sp. L36 TaxID=1747221 RepID=UPI00131E368A|nr:ATP-binding protein [Rhodanobacter sp. L36]